MADKEMAPGQTYATPGIADWIEATHVAEDEGSARALEAPRVHGIPAIQVSPVEAKALEIFLRMAQARNVVEVGTLAGYSAIHMARSLPEDGHLYCLEVDPRHARIAEENLRASGFSMRVTIVVGPGRETLGTIESAGPFDAVFIDADKVSYDHYGRWAAAHVRPGGLLIADNAFLFGRLLDDTKEAEAMRRFHVEATRAFFTTCLPTPDGMLLGIRK